ncbi:Di-copper centre-containing protein [Stipitochalara longipes BDJ]|nr:Di-copper centre-containing protein [Stipitochalara longipes BDJ]
MIYAHESVLKSECNYTGTIPWWNEALDAASGDFFQSDMWEDQWFGGNNSSVDNCVVSGLSYGARSNVDACYEYGGSKFEAFYESMALYPHMTGHQAVGGVMTDVDSSPRDPTFYLHHNYLDRLYWQWQQINAMERLYLIEGNTTVMEPSTGWKAYTLDTAMNMYGLLITYQWAMC